MSKDVTKQRGRFDFAVVGLDRLAMVLFVFTVLSVVYQPSARLIGNAWLNQSGYSHGPLVLLISAWLVWKESLSSPLQIPPMASTWLFLLAIASGLVWALSFVSATQAVQLLALIVISFCAVSWVFGSKLSLRFLVPVGFLVFAIPIWDLVTPTLQQLTIEVNSFLLSWLGWTTYFVGDIVHVRSGSFRIAQGCGGTHYFVVALSLGVLYAHVNYCSVKIRALFVLLAAITAMIANWVRVFVIVVVGDMTNMQHFLIKVDHYYFGWIVFVLAIIPLFAVGRALQSREEREGSEARSNLRTMEEAESLGQRRPVTGYDWASSVALALIILAPPFMAARSVDEHSVASNTELAIPGNLGSWHRVFGQRYKSLPSPRFYGAQAEMYRLYERNDQQLLLFLSRYERHRQGAELVGYENEWYPPEWIPRSAATTKGSTDGLTYELAVTILERGGQANLMLHGYLIGDRLIASGSEAKIRGALRSLLGKPTSGAVAIVLDCRSDCEKASEQAIEFLNEAAPVLFRVINQDAVSGTLTNAGGILG